MDRNILVNSNNYGQVWGALLLATKAGASLLEKLDQDSVEVTDAFWSYVDADEQWSMYVAMPLIKSQSLYEAALILHNVLYNKMSADERQNLTLSNISPVKPDSDKVREMRRRFGKVDYKDGYRIPSLNSSSYEPFIYRLNQVNSVASGN